jgi:predicted nucleotide-binding protein
MARPNVIFELGYCMGFFDLRYWEDDGIEPVILVAEDQTRLPSDLEGVERINYSNLQGQGISESFETLSRALNGIHTQVHDYFK